MRRAAKRKTLDVIMREIRARLLQRVILRIIWRRILNRYLAQVRRRFRNDPASRPGACPSNERLTDGEKIPPEPPLAISFLELEDSDRSTLN